MREICTKQNKQFNFPSLLEKKALIHYGQPDILFTTPLPKFTHSLIEGEKEYDWLTHFQWFLHYKHKKTKMKKKLCSNCWHTTPALLNHTNSYE